MAEYWKSTPKYWCKFCEIYVRDTGIERRNHEASGKHQGAIQRSLQKVHKGKQREEWEQQKAKNEVARLNGLVGQPKPASTASHAAKQPSNISSSSRVSAPAAAPMGDLTAQRRATAEQWLAMGVALPKELQQEVTGTGEWQTVSERVVKIVPKASEMASPTTLPPIKGVHKRKADDEEDEEDKLDGPRVKKAWGSRFKSHGHNTESTEAGGDVDLDTLLSNVTKKREASQEDPAHDPAVKTEENASIKHERNADATDTPEVKQEEGESAVTAPPVVTFKKRKAKR